MSILTSIAKTIGKKGKSAVSAAKKEPIRKTASNGQTKADQAVWNKSTKTATGKRETKRFNTVEPGTNKAAQRKAAKKTSK